MPCIFHDEDIWQHGLVSTAGRFVSASIIVASMLTEGIGNADGRLRMVALQNELATGWSKPSSSEVRRR